MSTQTTDPQNWFAATLDSDAQFWKSYIAARPSPSEDLFHLITKHHALHSEGRTKVAHDVGTGPGNIATRMLLYFDRVVGSDVNATALAAAPKLVGPDQAARLTFVQSPAEQLGSAAAAAVEAAGDTDLVVVSECMPLLDPVRALDAFHGLLRPRGTLAVYFYGRPVFVMPSGECNGAAEREKEQAVVDKCNMIYDRLAVRVCQFLWPFQGSPGFLFQRRGAEALASSLDSIAIPADKWTNVRRTKWNHKFGDGLLFSGRQGFDFEIAEVDNLGPGEETVAADGEGHWTAQWGADCIGAYLSSVFPNYEAKAGGRRSEVTAMLEEMRGVLVGGKRKVVFPAVLILATRK